MSRKLRNALLILVSCPLMLRDPATAEAYRLVRSVFADGACSMAGSGFLLRGTLGQGYSSAQGVMCNGGFCIGPGFWSTLVPPTTGIDDILPIPTLPSTVELGSPHPLPASGLVSLPVALPRPAAVELAVYDVHGRRLWAANAGILPAGYHTIHWDGRVEGGQDAPTGIYFARLIIDGDFAGGERKIVRVR